MVYRDRVNRTLVVHVKSTTVEMLDDLTGEVQRMQVRTERMALQRWLESAPKMKLFEEGQGDRVCRG